RLDKATAFTVTSCAPEKHRQPDGRLKWIALVCAGLLAFVMSASNPASALEVDVTSGKIEPLPIALPAFLGDSPDTQKFGGDIVQVVADNLSRSGFFRALPPQSYIEQITNFEQEPRFGDWRQIQARALVTGVATLEGGRLRAQFRLWDVGAQQQIAAFEFTTSPKNWRRLGHLISDKIYKAL